MNFYFILLFFGIILIYIGEFRQKIKRVVLLEPRSIQEEQGIYNENLPGDYILNALNSSVSDLNFKQKRITEPYYISQGI